MKTAVMTDSNSEILKNCGKQYRKIRINKVI